MLDNVEYTLRQDQNTYTYCPLTQRKKEIEHAYEIIVINGVTVLFVDAI